MRVLYQLGTHLRVDLPFAVHTIVALAIFEQLLAPLAARLRRVLTWDLEAGAGREPLALCGARRLCADAAAWNHADLAVVCQDLPLHPFRLRLGIIRGAVPVPPLVDLGRRSNTRERSTRHTCHQRFRNPAWKAVDATHASLRVFILEGRHCRELFGSGVRNARHLRRPRGGNVRQQVADVAGDCAAAPASCRNSSSISRRSLTATLSPSTSTSIQRTG